MSSEEESGWLIERQQPDTIEWAWITNYKLSWTTDHMKALRFARREDANQLIDGFPDLTRGAYAAEHIWY